MICALLEGKKTQTRRVLKPQPWNPERERDPDFDGWQTHHAFQHKCRQGIVTSAHGIGTKLWVRERWSGTYAYSNTTPRLREDFICDGFPHLRGEIWYWADGSPEYGDWERPRVSIHMPRWASRLTLTVTDVRVQRLQDISETDAIAEGIESLDGSGPNRFSIPINEGWMNAPTAKECFQFLWDYINGPGAWDSNPWVTAYSFDVHHCNIDDLDP